MGTNDFSTGAVPILPISLTEFTCSGCQFVYAGGGVPAASPHVASRVGYGCEYNCCWLLEPAFANACVINFTVSSILDVGRCIMLIEHRKCRFRLEKYLYLKAQV